MPRTILGTGHTKIKSYTPLLPKTYSLMHVTEYRKQQKRWFILLVWPGCNLSQCFIIPS